VYASLWNFRAFDERQVYRIDHFETAMGVLVHQSFDDEKANGVGVTTDPAYGTIDTFYLNTQVGENLVTNPELQSVPEAILLGSADGSGYTIVRRSNQVPDDVQVMTEPYLDPMREHLGVIEAQFRKLYGAVDVPSFAMEIEYKITADDILAIKQARPWVSDDSEVPVRPPPSATPSGQPTVTPTETQSAVPSATASTTSTPGVSVMTVFLPYLWRP
jgi:hypothetical protein